MARLCTTQLFGYISFAVAAGRAKTRAILGALRTGVVDVLCTDEQTASAVLQAQSSETEDL